MGSDWRGDARHSLSRLPFWLVSQSTFHYYLKSFQSFWQNSISFYFHWFVFRLVCIWVNLLIGRCYITTPAAVRRLLETFEVERPSLFWIDDVWVTGFLGPMAGIKLVSLNLYFTVYRWAMHLCHIHVGQSQKCICLLRKYSSNCNPIQLPALLLLEIVQLFLPLPCRSHWFFTIPYQRACPS